MNCFHFSVSLGYTTTLTAEAIEVKWLWIAFIFQYLWDTQQRIFMIRLHHHRCELLSFFSIFGIHNNIFKLWSSCNFVVNCFHFSVSLGYTTTQRLQSKKNILLWIAFIFQYLWDTQQQKLKITCGISSCELLSFFSIFGIHNNPQGEKVEAMVVVNCFHFSVSLGYTTTIVRNSLSTLSLWIAFIFQYLWDTQQHGRIQTARSECCELLSFFSIFGIHNNYEH